MRPQYCQNPRRRLLAAVAAMLLAAAFFLVPPCRCLAQEAAPAESEQASCQAEQAEDNAGDDMPAPQPGQPGDSTPPADPVPSVSSEPPADPAPQPQPVPLMDISQAVVFLEQTEFQATGEAVEPPFSVILPDPNAQPEPDPDPAAPPDPDEVEESVPVKPRGTLLVRGADYEAVFHDNVCPGQATIEVRGIGLFEGTLVARFTLVAPDAQEPDALAGEQTRPRPIGQAWVSFPEVSVYTGGPVEPVAAVYYDGALLVPGTDYTVSFSNNTSAGTGIATLTGMGAYSGTATREFTIACSIAEAQFDMPATSFAYTGYPVAPKPYVYLWGDTLTEGIDYRLWYSPNVEAGLVSVFAVGINRYVGAASTTFTIEHVQFYDTDPASWYVTGGYLDFAVGAGLMSGYGDSGLFGPYNSLTRGQVATIVYRYATGDSDGSGDWSSFDDVAPGMYYTGAIEWCRENGIVGGYSGSNRFGPNDPITREQLATVLYRFATNYLGIGNQTASIEHFSDAAQVSDFAKTAVGWCYFQGILTGNLATGTPLIDPQGLATRAQATKMFSVLLGYSPGAPGTFGCDVGPVIARAFTYIGMPYAYGGDGTQGGIDCSGLTSAAYGGAIEHWSYGQYRNCVNAGTFTTELNLLDPGDLVFYSYDGGATTYHVALYIGYGMVVDAVTSSGVGIRDVNYCEGAFGGGTPRLA